MKRLTQILAWMLAGTSAVPCQQIPSVPPASVAIGERMAALLNSSPLVQHGRIGYKFVNVETGEILAEGNSSTFFTPASNTKLYTTALALVRLGADYRFHTEVRTSGAWTPGQGAISDLLLIGGGDPNLSGRMLPYLVDEPEGDPLRAFKQLADQIANEGIHEIKGDILGVNTRYGDDAYPDGWTLDDSTYSYGAPVSALVLNDNTATLILRPTQVGELAGVETRPSFSGFIILNQVITDDSKSSHIVFRRSPGSNEVTVEGTIGKSVDQWREDLGVNDPALFAAETMAGLLRDRGIVVRGEPRSSGTAPTASGTLLAARESAPLSDAIQIANKVSQNLHAEMLLREVAFCRTGTGTLPNGLKEREAFLQEAGITREGTSVALADGSGLARQDLTTPDATVALLRYMWSRPERDVWLRSLPIGSLDGSLEHRFRKLAGAQRVHAKTGSLAHVNALSGYIETQKSGSIAFSVMVNGTVERESQVREFIDRLCAVFSWSLNETSHNVDDTCRLSFVRAVSIFLKLICGWTAQIRAPLPGFRMAISDHARGCHGKAIGTPATLRFYRMRLWKPDDQDEPQMFPLEFGEIRDWNGAALIAYPASHILGAAQLLVEFRGERLVYTGDIKLRQPLCGNTTEPVPCDRLIIESTFGLPLYKLLSREEATERIVSFARACLADGAVPTFIGYALGRGQEIVHVLCQAGIPTAVHGAIARFLPVYEEYGHQFPGWEPYESGAITGKALVVIPAHGNVLGSSGRNVRLAYVSGWAALDNARSRSGAERLIPYSDHADFDELLTLVHQSAPKHIDVVHGYTVPFAKILQSRGYSAAAPHRTSERTNIEAEG